MTLDDARLFVTIARAASLSAAGRVLDRSPAAVSAALAKLETGARVRLVQRTTRALELTEEGRVFLHTCEGLLVAWEEGERRLAAAREGVGGELRVTGPADLSQQHLAGWIAGFVAVYPEVRVTLLVGDALAALPRDGVDVAVRYGALDDSTLVAVRLGHGERCLVAAPAYLDGAGRPERPAELARHRTLAWLRRDRPHTRWELFSEERAEAVEVSPVLCGDGAVVRQWAVAGEGIAFKSRLDVAADLAAGRLEVVLPDWRGSDLPLTAVVPAGRLRSRRVEALVAWLRERVGELEG